MRIIIFDGSFKTTIFINRLIKGLVQAGHEIYVLGFNEELSKKIERVHYISLGSNQSYFKLIKTSLRLGFESSLFDGFKSLSYILNKNRKLLQKQNLDIVLKKIQPDIIHIQWLSLMKWLSQYYRTNIIKIILSQRGFQVNIRPFIDQEFKEKINRYYPALDGIHSVSNYVDRKSQIFSSSNKALKKVIYSGLDLDHLEFNNCFKINKKLKILSVGRSHWVKGYDTSIKAMCFLREKEISFCYDIVGAASQEELLFLVKKLDLEHQVNLLPKMNQNNVFNKIKNADIMLISSVEEGLPNVAVEAMALGTPVISTDCGGMQELINHNNEGWIVPKRNLKAMAEAILNFTTLTDKEIETIRLNARNKVEKQHSEQKMISDMENLYNKVVDIKI